MPFNALCDQNVVTLYIKIWFVVAYVDSNRLCNHRIPEPQKVVYDVPLSEPRHVIRKRSANQHLRIQYVYDDSVNKLSEEKRRMVKNEVIPNAVSFWERTLRVRKTSKPIRLLRQCNSDQVLFKEGEPFPYCVNGCHNVTMCGYNSVPAQHLERCREARIGAGYQVWGERGPGARDTDFILYVSAYETTRCDVGSTVAYAAYCQLEAATDRPIAGYVNLCPESLSTNAHELHQVQSTIKHEILHALGFSAGLFAFYRDDAGRPLTPRFPLTGKPHFNDTLNLYQWSERVVKPVVLRDWRVRNGLVNRTVHMVVTPRVRKEVRRHFNCPSLEGAELEDQGVLGTSMTHWEKRLFENEVMTGTHTQNAVISRLTLAMMEDTGWYRADYSQAQELTWGRALGCDFAQRSCLDWMLLKERRKESPHPYCSRVKTGSLRTECTPDGSAVALCNLIEYSRDLPPHYQHFLKLDGVHRDNVPRYAGSVMLADYCPYIQEFNWKNGDVVVRGSQCQIPYNNAEAGLNYLLEDYGNRSRCILHRNPFELMHCNVKQPVENWGSGCYEHRCDPDRGLIIVIAEREFLCPRAGHVVNVQAVSSVWLHRGSLLCPSCQEVCENKDDPFSCPASEVPTVESSEQVSLRAPCSGSPPLVHQSLTICAIVIHGLVVMVTSYCRRRSCLPS